MCHIHGGIRSKLGNSEIKLQQRTCSGNCEAAAGHVSYTRWIVGKHLRSAARPSPTAEVDHARNVLAECYFSFSTPSATVEKLDKAAVGRPPVRWQIVSTVGRQITARALHH